MAITNNGGRKPTKDKAIQVGCYVKTSAVKQLGGKNKVRLIQLAAIETELQKKS